MFNRLEGCTEQALSAALTESKTLLQAWSFRGAPVIFPTKESSVFLTALIPQGSERPWIYTRGMTRILDRLDLPLEDLLRRQVEVIGCLDDRIVKSKKNLDQLLADLIYPDLPPDRQKIWLEPSGLENLGLQTVGHAAVSFLLRPCSFLSLVVFGVRIGVSPTFTSFKNWIDREPDIMPEAEAELVRKFLHCYGPSTARYFSIWLGCSLKQAKRLWQLAAPEMAAVTVDGKTAYMLECDLPDLLDAEGDEGKLLLLGSNDPYLGLRDRKLILPDESLHKMIWKFVGNPGVVLKGGRIIGTWNTIIHDDTADFRITVWKELSAVEEDKLKALARKYVAFRSLKLRIRKFETNSLEYL